MREELFEELLESVQQMQEIRKGARAPARVTTPADLGLTTAPDAAAIRLRMKLSQSRFAGLLNISVRTLQGWEQKRREPEGPARVLLQVAERNPRALLELHEGTVVTARPARIAARKARKTVGRGAIKIPASKPTAARKK